MQVMLCQSDLISLHKWGLDDSQSHTTVRITLIKIWLEKQNDILGKRKQKEKFIIIYTFWDSFYRTIGMSWDVYGTLD